MTAPSAHLRPRPSAGSALGLLAALAAGPAAWIIQLVVDYGVSSWLCDAGPRDRLASTDAAWIGVRPILLAGEGLCLAATLAGCVFAVAVLARRAPQPADLDRDLQIRAGRSRFMAACAVFSTAGFAVAISFNLAEFLISPSCGGC